MTIDRTYVRDRFLRNSDVVLHRGKSEKILREFPDAYFDWVYIDGNHYYEFVRADLQMSLAKVKPGGIISGDDYFWGEADGFPVKRAVQDFIEKNSVTAGLEILDSQYLIRLPGTP